MSYAKNPYSQPPRRRLPPRIRAIYKAAVFIFVVAGAIIFGTTLYAAWHVTGIMHQLSAGQDSDSKD